MVLYKCLSRIIFIAQENYKSQFGKEVGKEDTDVMKNKQDSSQERAEEIQTAQLSTRIAAVEQYEKKNSVHALNHGNNKVQEVTEFNNDSSTNKNNRNKNFTTDNIMYDTNNKKKDYDDGNDVKVVQQPLIRNVETNVNDIVDDDDDDDVIESVLKLKDVKSCRVVDDEKKESCVDGGDGGIDATITTTGLSNGDNYKNNNNTVENCDGGGGSDGIVEKPQIKRKAEQKNEHYQQLPPSHLPIRPSTTQSFKLVNTHSPLMNRCRSASSLSSSVFKRKELENEDYHQHHLQHHHHQTAELHFESKTTTNNIELNTKVDITSSESGGNNSNINKKNAPNDDGCDENGLVKIDWKKVVTFLKCGPTSGKLKLLQAIRWVSLCKIFLLLYIF